MLARPQRRAPVCLEEKYIHMHVYMYMYIYIYVYIYVYNIDICVAYLPNLARCGVLGAAGRGRSGVPLVSQVARLSSLKLADLMKITSIIWIDGSR